MLKIAICDDNEVICEELESLVKEYGISNKVHVEIDVYYTGKRLCDEMKETYYDLILLDIEMQGLNGVEVGQTIRESLHNESTQILFISSKVDYAMALFDVRPLNFLVKPIDKEKLYWNMDKCFELVKRNESMFTYQNGSKINKCKLKDILYFESRGRKVEIVLNHRRETFYSALHTIYDEVKDKDFFYCHKSLVVNYHNIVTFYYDRLILTNGEELEISQGRRKEVRELQKKWEMRV